jgi:hypothetical protein
VTNPFGDIEREAEEERLRYLDLVRKLDGMEDDVTPWEAEFLDTAIKQLRDEKRMLSMKQITVLNDICEKYNVY